MLIQLNIFLSLALSFTIVFFVIPKIIKVSKIKNLFDVPNHRSAAKQIVPTLGGISIFAGYTISLIVASGNYNLNDLKYMFAAIIVMFFIGLKDDIIGLSAKKKIIGQIIMSIYLVILGNYRITNLHGILGIQQINFLSGAIITVIAIVGIINAVNLIDGIDGLASGVGLLISTVYGFWFLNAGDYIYAIACFSLTGTLIAFFLYNVFGTSNKIFMGDTGSLILGTIIALLTIHFNELNPANNNVAHGLPAISLAIIIIPVIDTIRIFAIRLSQGKSPFSPDMNHIHHLVLRLTGSHLKASLIIIAINAIMIFLAFSLIESLGNSTLFILLLASGFILVGILTWVLKVQKKYVPVKLGNRSIYVLSLFMRKPKESLDK
jgi:UDP-N-acetylmuramyl pentapeptide phosphotransferase/UDP-N-acetylglucosamine-1-phosphate transferase